MGDVCKFDQFCWGQKRIVFVKLPASQCWYWISDHKMHLFQSSEGTILNNLVLSFSFEYTFLSLCFNLILQRKDWSWPFSCFYSLFKIHNGFFTSTKGKFQECSVVFFTGVFFTLDWDYSTTYARL